MCLIRLRPGSLSAIPLSLPVQSLVLDPASMASSDQLVKKLRLMFSILAFSQFTDRRRDGLDWK
jgi:hypothetical protein